MEELEASHAPLRRSDLAGLTGLTELALRGPDVLFRWWPTDLLAELPSLQTLDLELFRIYLPSDLWHAGPTLGLRLPDVDFHSRMGYPYWMFPYLLDAGLSGTRLAALLATSPLRHLTLESRAL